MTSMSQAAIRPLNDLIGKHHPFPALARINDAHRRSEYLLSHQVGKFSDVINLFEMTDGVDDFVPLCFIQVLAGQRIEF